MLHDELRVLKHGVGYDLVLKGHANVDGDSTLVLGIRCHTCHRTSFHPKDISERYCGACKVFHEEHLLDNEA
jgi:hypothetical protein